MHIGICRSNPNNTMAQLATGMLCVVYTALVTPFSIEWEYVTPWFNINKSTKFSPFYLLYNHDPVLPIDNILKPRRRYLGEEPHKIGLEQQCKSFLMVHQYLEKAKRRQERYVDNSQYTEFQVGDPVYRKQLQCKSKPQGWCYPNYRIIEETVQVTFHL